MNENEKEFYIEDDSHDELVVKAGETKVLGDPNQESYILKVRKLTLESQSKIVFLPNVRNVIIEARVAKIKDAIIDGTKADGKDAIDQTGQGKSRRGRCNDGLPGLDGVDGESGINGVNFSIHMGIRELSRLKIISNGSNGGSGGNGQKGGSGNKGSCSFSCRGGRGGKGGNGGDGGNGGNGGQIFFYSKLVTSSGEPINLEKLVPCDDFNSSTDISQLVKSYVGELNIELENYGGQPGRVGKGGPGGNGGAGSGECGPWPHWRFGGGSGGSRGNDGQPGRSGTHGEVDFPQFELGESS